MARGSQGFIHPSRRGVVAFSSHHLTDSHTDTPAHHRESRDDDDRPQKHRDRVTETERSRGQVSSSPRRCDRSYHVSRPRTPRSRSRERSGTRDSDRDRDRDRDVPPPRRNGSGSRTRPSRAEKSSGRVQEQSDKESSREQPAATQDGVEKKKKAGFIHPSRLGLVSFSTSTSALTSTSNSVSASTRDRRSTRSARSAKLVHSGASQPHDRNPFHSNRPSESSSEGPHSGTLGIEKISGDREEVKRRGTGKSKRIKLKRKRNYSNSPTHGSRPAPPRASLNPSTKKKSKISRDTVIKRSKADSRFESFDDVDEDRYVPPSLSPEPDKAAGTARTRSRRHRRS